VRMPTITHRSLTVGALVALSAGVVVPAAAAAAGRQPHTSSGRAGVVSYHAAAQVSLPPHVGTIIDPESSHPLALTNGYVEKEFFISGRATAFTASSAPKSGKWSIARTTSAAYRTRILVRRPPKSRFNGTVIVEWMNVTEGESAPDWDYLNPMLMRAGYAYVAVSDQALGINGGTSLLGGTFPGLKGSDPDRYGSLVHPGDQYSLDIFAQLGLALQNGKTAARVLGGLHPAHIVATGESQSAFYLTSFADALQPLTNAYDGIFIHSRGGSAAVDGSITTGPYNVRIRTDLGVPVFMFETETDLVELQYATAQQPNTRWIRAWEVAGTSHADRHVVGPYASFLGCSNPINNGPQHVVIEAAFSAFNKWVSHGTPPPSPNRFTFSSTDPTTLARAADGDVIGGVRTPAVDVPIETLTGEAPSGVSTVCSLFGSRTPFTQSELATRYGTPAHYVSLFTASLDRAIAHGYVLKAARATLLKRADKVSF